MFYLGRTQGQQSISKKDGVYYREYLNVVDIKKVPLTKKYNAGDIIINNLQRIIYLGKFYKHIEANRNSNRYDDKPRITLKQLDKKNMETNHLYAHIRDDGSAYIHLEENKKGGRVVDSIDDNRIQELINQEIEYIVSRITIQRNGMDYWHIQTYISDYLALKGIEDKNVALGELKKIVEPGILNES